MKRWIAAVLVLTCTAAVILIQSPAVKTAHAKHWGYSDADLLGCYAFQLAGNYVFPPNSPMATLNGPFAVNGRICADGQGHIKKSFTSNFNGVVYRAENAESSYEVRPDGTFTETFVTPFFGGSFATVTYEGVLVSEGAEARVIVTGFSLPGLQLPAGQIGMVITGSMKRQ